MGLSQQKLDKRAEEVKILMIGLDEVGKTTLLNNIELGSVSSSTSSIGFTVETLKYKNVKIISWGAGIRDKIRPLWRHYYEGMKAIILVVDSSDSDRIEFVQYIMRTILSEEELKNCVFAVVANKQDINGGMSEKRIWKILNLTAISQTRPCAIFGTSAINGLGLFDALDWILNTISKTSVDERRDSDDASGNIGQKDCMKTSIFKKPIHTLKDYIIN